nr:type I polyketide synthase [Actinokineospora bangkokensis]
MTPPTTPPTTPVAIVGMAALFPGAPDLDAYWRNIAAGTDAITDVPADRWDPGFFGTGERRADRVYCRRGGFVDAEVDVAGFGVMPNSVPGTEPDQLIALHVAAASLADAGGEAVLPADRERVGVILGRGGYLTPGLVRLDQRVRTANQVVKTLREVVPDLDDERVEAVRAAFVEQLGPAAPESAIGLVPNLAASRVANRLDLRGPAYTVDAACASSLIAVDHAVRELAEGRADVMFAGGVHHCHDITLWSTFSQLGALSPSQRIRPFHRGADGVLIAEGTGVVVLKRLADAERDGDRVYAVVSGTGVASDGRSASLLNPDPAGQARAVRRAWDAAGLDPRDPDSVGLIEAHGTATPAGDAAELSTLAEVFGPGTPAALGSVKSMIGHAMPAAGIAGLIKAALALHHRVLPPTLHCDDPNPAVARTRFAPLAEATPWRAPDSGAPRRAGVNAFGFGGINAHVVLTEPAPARVEVVEPVRVLRLAAATPRELGELLAAGDPGLDERARTTEPCRLGVVEPTPRKLKLAAKAIAKGVPWSGRSDVWFAPEPLPGRTAFVFPGLEAEFEPEVADVAALFGLPWSTGEASVGDIGRHGTAVFQVGRLLDAALRRLGVVPDAVAGHSVGEWTAMAAGGIHAADEVDAFLETFDPDSLVVPGVAFAVLGMPAAEVLAVLPEHPEVVLSHDNAPSQAMVCGPREQVEALVTRMRVQEGVLGRILPFQSGFHTPMLAPYLGPIRDAAQTYTLNPQATPVWSATTAAPYPAEPEAVRELFVRHLLEPVRFRQLVLAMHDAGFRTFLQLGAGQLGSLVDDTLAGRPHTTVSAHGGLLQLRKVVTALWVDGADPDASPLLPAGTAAAVAPAARRPKVKLALGSPLVSLPPEQRPVARPRVPAAQAFAGLETTAHPIAAELSALLHDTAGVAAELIGAASGRRALPARPPATPAHLPAPPPPAPPVRPTPPVPPSGAVPASLRFDVESMPYLLDHCFFRQPDDWPDPADRWPVVPATTVVTHLMRIAEQAVPGTRAVGLRDVRLLKWIVAEPAAEVPVTARVLGPDRVEVTLVGCSQATVELAPAPGAPPAAWPVPDDDRVPERGVEVLYDERWMFHGPRFQGVAEITGIGARHVRGVLTGLAAPGALLDNVGQLFGYWIMAVLPERTTVFPVRMERVGFHGSEPVPGERLDCLIRITEVTAGTVTADMQLSRGGVVWAQFTGWTDRRFDTDPGIRAMDRWPGRNTLSTVDEDGVAVVHERWPDLATRELIMRNNLAGAERDAYDAQPPNRRRQFLLGRIAAKDAARTALWRAGAGEVYPAELAITNDATGKPVLRGVHGRDPGGLTVSIAHCREVGVGIAATGPCGVDVEEVVARPDRTVDAACDPAERALLDGLGGDRALWFTRFWAAKEAVAKARGTGLGGRPQSFRVVHATAERLRVQVEGAVHVVRVRSAENPPGLPARDYVVAWTGSAADRADRPGHEPGERE